MDKIPGKWSAVGPFLDITPDIKPGRGSLVGKEFRVQGGYQKIVIDKDKIVKDWFSTGRFLEFYDREKDHNEAIWVRWNSRNGHASSHDGRRYLNNFWEARNDESKSRWGRLVVSGDDLKAMFNEEVSDIKRRARISIAINGDSLKLGENIIVNEDVLGMKEKCEELDAIGTWLHALEPNLMAKRRGIEQGLYQSYRDDFKLMIMSSPELIELLLAVGEGEKDYEYLAKISESLSEGYRLLIKDAPVVLRFSVEELTDTDVYRNMGMRIREAEALLERQALQVSEN